MNKKTILTFLSILLFPNFAFSGTFLFCEQDNIQDLNFFYPAVIYIHDDFEDLKEGVDEVRGTACLISDQLSKKNIAGNYNKRPPSEQIIALKDKNSYPCNGATKNSSEYRWLDGIGSMHTIYRESLVYGYFRNSTYGVTSRNIACEVIDEAEAIEKYDSLISDQVKLNNQLVSEQEKKNKI